MTISDGTNDKTASTRAGGNVESKGASQTEAAATENVGTRAGGNVESKGASGGSGEKKAAEEE